MPPDSERRPAVNGAATNRLDGDNEILAPAPDLDRLDAISYAAAVGYGEGVAHGRALERALIADEHRQAHAGRIVAALADIPEADPAHAAARDAARTRLSGGGRR